MLFDRDGKAMKRSYWLAITGEIFVQLLGTGKRALIEELGNAVRLDSSSCWP
jgi:hypothetical protein